MKFHTQIPLGIKSNETPTREHCYTQDFLKKDNKKNVKYSFICLGGRVMIIIYLTDKHVKFEARNRIPALQPPAPRSQSARRPLEPEKRKTGTRLRPQHSEI